MQAKPYYVIQMLMIYKSANEVVNLFVFVMTIIVDYFNEWILTIS